MIPVLFAASDQNWADFSAPLNEAFAARELEVDLQRDHPPQDVAFIIYAPDGTIDDFTPFQNLQAVFSLWAGVEQIVGNKSLKAPLTRMVDPGLEEGMSEWVTGHVLRYHLGMDAHIHARPGEWVAKAAPLARQRSVGILGLGTLGTAAAFRLADLNFQVHGWSRRLKALPGIQTYSGTEGLHALLQQAEILVLLLPDTVGTQNILDAKHLAMLPRGAKIINPGRGPLIDDDALLEALNAGQVAHATLDVFRTEPLPADHPYWHHPNVTVTPHIASETRPETAAEVIADNLARALAGQSIRHLVDRTTGY